MTSPTPHADTTAAAPRKLGGTLYLDTPYATMARRVTAWFLDVTLWVLVWFIGDQVLTAFEWFSLGAAFALYFGVIGAAFVYWWLMTGLTGQTLGKKATGIKVVRTDAPNARFGLGYSAGRCAIFVALFVFPLGQVVNLLLMAADAPENRGIHDRALDSRVVQVGIKLAPPTPAA